jgi:hypothetical protein
MLGTSKYSQINLTPLLANNTIYLSVKFKLKVLSGFLFAPNSKSCSYDTATFGA